MCALTRPEQRAFIWCQECDQRCEHLELLLVNADTLRQLACGRPVSICRPLWNYIFTYSNQLPLRRLPVYRKQKPVSLPT